MISLIQTAEGALNETHAILQRMRELAVQSSNDTNTDSDRGELQKELNQLNSALNDISKDTEFNTKKLLDGSFEGTFHVGANQGQSLSISIEKMDAESLKVNGYSGDAVELTGVTGVKVSNNTNAEVKINFTTLGDEDADAVEKTTAKLNEDGSITVTLAQEAGKGTGNGAGAVTATHEDVVNALKGIGSITVETDDSYDGTAKVTGVTAPTETTVTAGTVDSEKGINISNQKAADSAITTLQSAIDTVSAERSKLGAVQNRLEHTINNLGASAENLTAAESRIRDVDYDLVAA
ncbi:flagellin [Virgibacillus soli]|uniref:Flagellin n=1 Tax=Paracerasibacillus soli TaxID=480284 RepID=A0ABU5CTL3_9BACI|nr:flagellin [Virgibacillus soli]MDY0409717.1 flagellin [Virgibacillus soli]